MWNIQVNKYIDPVVNAYKISFLCKLVMYIFLNVLNICFILQPHWLLETDRETMFNLHHILYALKLYMKTNNALVYHHNYHWAICEISQHFDSAAYDRVYKVNYTKIKSVSMWTIQDNLLMCYCYIYSYLYEHGPKTESCQIQR